MTAGKEHKPAGEGVRAWLPLLLALLTMAATWGTVRQRVDEHERRIEEVGVHVKENRQDIDHCTETFADVRVTLAEIQRDIIYIREQMEDDNER